MGGSKRNKLKKIISPPPPEPIVSSEMEDEELMDDLLAQLDSRDKTVQSESAAVLKEMQLDQRADAIETKPKQDARSRFKARQARKAATLANSMSPDNPEHQARLEQEAKAENRDIKKVCDQLDLGVHEINPDGHCLFSAVADQLALLSLLPPEQASYAITRRAACDYMFSHPDEFLPFLPSMDGEDGVGATDAGMMTPQAFERYCASIRDTAVWGGEPEILALSRAFNIPIHIVQGGNPPVVIHTPDGSPGDPEDKRAVKISYHRRLFGLGEHYNSLRPQGGLHKLTNAVQQTFSS